MACFPPLSTGNNVSVFRNPEIKGTVQGAVEANGVGISNVQVLLKRGNETVEKAVTEVNGTFTAGVVPGDYVVDVAMDSLPNGTVLLSSPSDLAVSVKDLGDTLNVTIKMQIPRNGLCGGNNCHMNATCVNKNCVCDANFTGDGVTCLTILGRLNGSVFKLSSNGSDVLGAVPVNLTLSDPKGLVVKKIQTLDGKFQLDNLPENYYTLEISKTDNPALEWGTETKLNKSVVVLPFNTSVVSFDLNIANTDACTNCSAFATCKTGKCYCNQGYTGSGIVCIGMIF
jgi:hypothetical protein